MGVCHECLMEIDGMPDQQACLIEVKDGMKVERQTGLPEVGN
jgi:predicted molibdopterin-dependent oxidoreductase YjgC